MSEELRFEAKDVSDAYILAVRIADKIERIYGVRLLQFVSKLEQLDDGNEAVLIQFDDGLKIVDVKGD